MDSLNLFFLSVFLSLLFFLLPFGVDAPLSLSQNDCCQVLGWVLWEMGVVDRPYFYALKELRATKLRNDPQLAFQPWR